MLIDVGKPGVRIESVSVRYDLPVTDLHSGRSFIMPEDRKHKSYSMNLYHYSLEDVNKVAELVSSGVSQTRVRCNTKLKISSCLEDYSHYDGEMPTYFFRVDLNGIYKEKGKMEVPDHSVFFNATKFLLSQIPLKPYPCDSMRSDIFDFVRDYSPLNLEFPVDS